MTPLSMSNVIFFSASPVITKKLNRVHFPHGESLNFSNSAKEGVTVASPVSGTQDEALFPTAKDRHHRSRDPLAVDLWRPPAATLQPVAVAFITHFFLSVFFHLALLVCVCTGKKGELLLLSIS